MYSETAFKTKIHQNGGRGVFTNNQLKQEQNNSISYNKAQINCKLIITVNHAMYRIHNQKESCI